MGMETEMELRVGGSRGGVIGLENIYGISI
jgi:hypothetical protein